MKEVLGSLPEVITAYKNYNLLVPTATDVQLNPFYKFHVEEVPVDLGENSGDIFKVGSVKTGKQDERGKDIWEDVFSLSKPLLNKMAMAAGIQFNPKETYGERIDRVTYRAQAQGAMRKADGTARTETDQKVICLEDEEEKYRIEFADKAAKGITDEKQAQAAAEIFSGQWVESKNKWGKKCQAFVIAKEDRDRYIDRSVMVNMALLKKTWAEKAMTGAKLRVIRALLGVKGTYTKAELQKNFAIPTVIFSPDFSDPQVRQAMLTQGMNSVNNMFGTPQIAVKSVDFESESTVFTQDDLDNPAYASDTESEDDYPPMQEPDIVPEPKPEPEPDRSADFQCSRCGEVINERVDVKEGMSICDPACGVGKFLLEAASKISSPFYFENGKLKAKIELVGMEKKMEDNTYDLTTILAKSNMLIYYSDLFKNNCDSIEKIQELSEQLLNKVITSSHTTLGTLENLYLDKYDLILANPPYYQSAAISEASKSVKIYGTETKAYTSGGRGIEALFTEWIVKSIKKGGIANIILPDGIFTNIGNNKLKQLIIENCYIDSIISLPVGTFFNTPKKTFILTIHKRTEEEMNKIQSYPVYTYLCSTIGETMDTYRFDIDENDLHDAVDLYNLYRGNKENKIAISAVNDNPRAKLIPVDKFGIEENWNIELFWSDEEKIELGIKKKDTIMSLEEFHGYISELIDDIKNYQEAIECLK